MGDRANDLHFDSIEIPTYNSNPRRSSSTINRPLTQIPVANDLHHCDTDRDEALAFEIQRQEQEVADRRPLARMASSVWHFEYGDQRPVFTILMIFLNLVGFLITMYIADWELAPFSENPMIGPSGQVLIDAGAQTSTLVSCDGDYWRIISACFLHAGIVHLGFNMMSLWQLGSALEKDFGTWQVVLIYTLSGLSGQLASAVFLPDAISIGASGAVYGLFGAAWADFLQNVAFFPELEGRCSGFVQLSFSTFIAIGFTLIPWVNAFAHLAGFITGSAVGYIVLIRKRVYTNRSGNERAKELTSCQKLLMFSSAAFIVMEILVLAVLWGEADVYSQCEWCKYLQCFDTPFWDCSQTQAASCSYTVYNSDTTQCVALDGSFDISQSCSVITCLDESTHAFTGIPTAFNCFDNCGSDYSQCA